jgi:putative membrane protein
MMWNGGYGMMGWGGGFGWLWPFHFLIPLLILGLIIAAVVAAVRYSSAGWEDRPGRAWRGSPGLDALDERYARGEINREEYMQKRRDILG